ncbi:MAG: leucine-rich repeat domain-containing protein [Mollicutes bacterium]|nr:leucine-rich repeat domain-containing protein [Mollicutes bacterium]
MKTKLFSKLLLLVTSFTLISCSFSSSGSGLKGNEDDYYKIDFYSDYADMDYSDSTSWDKTKAKYLGYGYILKDKDPSKQSVPSLTYLDETNKDYDYRKSSKVAENYFTYEFDGFYTAGDKSKPISDAVFTSSCDVFANFKQVYNKYLVKIFNDKEVVFSENLEYASSFVTNDETISIYERYAKDPLVTFRMTKDSLPYYYETAKFARFDIKRKNGDVFEDHSLGNATYYVDASYEIKALYNDLTYKKFDVNIPQKVTFGGKDIDTALFFTQEHETNGDNYVYKVTYNEAFEPKTKEMTIDGIKYVFTGFEDAIYADSTHEEVKGEPVDVNHIKDNVTLTPKFDYAKLQVTFHEGTTTHIKEVSYGSTINPISIDETKIPTGYVFSGDWYDGSKMEGIDLSTLYTGQTALDRQFESAKIDFSKPVTTNLDLYCVCIKKTLTEGIYSFEYDSSLKGYSLTGISSIPTAGLDMSSLLQNRVYDFKGIKKLNDKSINIDNIKFPSTLVKLYNDSLYGLGSEGSGTTLDLSNVTGELEIGMNAFRSMVKMVTLKLPTVKSIGKNAFAECDRLTTINVKNKEADSPDLFDGTGVKVLVEIKWNANY